MSQLLLAILFSTDGHGYDAFAGFQMDNQRQYFAYAGLRASLERPKWTVEPFLQVLAFRQKFFFRSEGQLLEGHLNEVSPALGITKSLGRLSLEASVGPAFLQSRQENVVTDNAGNLIRTRDTSNDVGYALTGYASYSANHDTFGGLISYSNLSDFFFGRLRWLHFAFETKGGVRINPGLDLSAAGNSDFQEVSAGGLLGTEIRKIGILLKGGYQNNSTFHGGGYGGIELSLRF